MEFIEVFNQVANVTVKKPANARDAESYDDEPIDVGLDSLDMVMVIAVLTDVYGIPDDSKFDDEGTVTLGTLRDYIDANKTRDPASMDEIMECV